MAPFWLDAMSFLDLVFSIMWGGHGELFLEVLASLALSMVVAPWNVFPAPDSPMTISVLGLDGSFLGILLFFVGCQSAVFG